MMYLWRWSFCIYGKHRIDALCSCEFGVNRGLPRISGPTLRSNRKPIGGAPQARLSHCRRRIDRTHYSGVGAWRNDFVDPVQDFVVKDDFGVGEQIFELLYRARAEDRRGGPLQKPSSCASAKSRRT
jgi:hypothetical protein